MSGTIDGLRTIILTDTRPIWRRIEAAELMLGYESPAVRNGQVRIEWKIWLFHCSKLAGLMRLAIKVRFLAPRPSGVF
jgi:hypothetical protein